MASRSSTDDLLGHAPGHKDAEHLPHFRYCLRDLLLYTAFLCLLLAGMVLTRGVGAAVVLLAALAVAAHVLSTALGSRLREFNGTRSDQQRWDGDQTNGTGDDAHVPDFATYCPQPRSSWHGHERIGRRRVMTLIFAGSLLGGILGGGFLFVDIGDRTSVAGIVIGAFSLVVLGGWLAFLASSFYMIFRHGLSEAIAEQQKDELTS
jgi:hypothetical protein